MESPSPCDSTRSNDNRTRQTDLSEAVETNVSFSDAIVVAAFGGVRDRNHIEGEMLPWHPGLLFMMALPVWCLQWATLVFVSLDFDLDGPVKTKSHTTESILTTLKIMMIVVVQLNLLGLTIRAARSLIFVLVITNWADESRNVPIRGKLFCVPLTIVYGKCVCGCFSVAAMITRMGILYATAMQSVSIILDSNNAPDVLFNCLAATFVAQIDEVWWVTMSEVLHVDPLLEFPSTPVQQTDEQNDEGQTFCQRHLRCCIPGNRMLKIFSQVCVFVLYARMISVVFYAYHTDVLPSARDVCTQWRWMTHQGTNDIYFATVYRFFSNFMFVTNPQDDIVQRADPSVGGYCTDEYHRMSLQEGFGVFQEYPVASVFSYLLLFTLTVGPRLFPSLSKYALKLAEENHFIEHTVEGKPPERFNIPVKAPPEPRRRRKDISAARLQAVSDMMNQNHEELTAETAELRDEMQNMQFELMKFRSQLLLEVSTLKSELSDLKSAQVAAREAQEPKDSSSTAELTTLTRGVQDLENFSEKMRNLHGVMELQVSRCVQELPELKSSVQELQEWKALQEKVMGDTERPHMPRKCDSIEGIDVQNERERLQCSEQKTVSDQEQSADVGVTVECHITQDKSLISATRAVSPAVKLEATGTKREHLLVPLLAAKTVNRPSPTRYGESEGDSITALDPPPVNPMPVGATPPNSCAQVYEDDGARVTRQPHERCCGQDAAPLHPVSGRVTPLAVCGSLASAKGSSRRQFSEDRPLLIRRLSPDRIISGTAQGGRLHLESSTSTYESPPVPFCRGPTRCFDRWEGAHTLDQISASCPGLGLNEAESDRLSWSVPRTNPPQLATTMRAERLHMMTEQSTRTPFLRR